MKSKRGILKLRIIVCVSLLIGLLSTGARAGMHLVPWSELDSEVAQYPFWLSWVYKPALRWQPWSQEDWVAKILGVGQAMSHEQCGLLEPGSAQTIDRNFFAQVQFCEENARTRWKPDWLHGLGTISIGENLRQTEELKPLVFEMKDPVSDQLIRLRGLVALQKSSEPRPMVVLRVGIFSNSFEFYPEKYLFEQMYREGKFHMLIVESVSNPYFSARNTGHALNNIAESAQTVEILQMIAADPIFSRMISNFHVIGVSMGGYGTLRMAVENPQISTQHPVKSYTLMCPLVQLEKTFAHHRSNPFRYWLLNTWAQKRFQKEAVDLLGENIGILQKHEITWQEFASIQTPTMVFASENDMLVPFELNAGEWLGPKNLVVSEDGKKAVIRMKTGIHCSVPTAYNWQASGAWLRAFIEAADRD